MRSVKPLVSQRLKMVYYDYFHSIMNYELIFGGKSSHSAKTFKRHKYITRITRGCKSRVTCRDLFKNLEILSHHSIYYQFSYLWLIANINLNQIPFSKNITSIKSSNSSLYQKEVFSIGMKVFNSLPRSIKDLSVTPKEVKYALRNT